MEFAEAALASMTAAGCVCNVAGAWATAAFLRRPADRPRRYPPVTILKPLCGPEPGLEAALASFCRQAYAGAVQLVIGAHDAADPALHVAHKVKRDFPDADIRIAASPVRRGSNGKIANLMNMLPLARHDILVIADSDLHVAPDYLDHVVGGLQVRGCGLVTSLPAGVPVVGGLAARLGAAHLAENFIPSALMARALGRQDCLGGTMALTRDTLARIGGLKVLAHHLADDNVLGRKVLALGLSVRVATTLPAIGVQETTLRDLWLHELRWARTIATIAPLSAAGCVLQYPLAWALLLCFVGGFAPVTLAVLALAWAVRLAAARLVAASLARRRPHPAPPSPAWLLPLRDCLSVAEILAGFCGDTVVWRGRTLHTSSQMRERTEAAAPELAPGA